MPKKKGKGNKLARMSDEERARYLQHRAELELEAKRRKQQLIAAFTKNKLKREEAFSRLNTAKINEQWRFILRRIKCKELHEDVEYLWKNFDRMMKTKDVIIQRLYGELGTADADHRRLQEAHIQIMDLMIGKYRQKCTHLHEFFAHERDHVALNEVNKLHEVRRALEKQCEQLQNMIFGQDKEIEDRLTQTKIQNAANIYSVVYLKEDSLSRLMQYTCHEIEALWRQLNETITEYESSTENKRKQYEYLKEQDDVHRADVAQYPRLHAQLQSTIKNLKQDTHTLSEKREQSIVELKNQIAHMRKQTESLRQAFAVTRGLDVAQLKKLTTISTNVLKELQRISEKGSALLSLLKMCLSLEPFSLTVQKYTLRDTGSRRAFTSCMSEPFDKLEKFWEQFNYIKADNIFMKKECDKLTFENKQLRNTLRTYLLAVSRAQTARPLTSISV
ncbi:dynein regulatory complex subunit 2 isoform X2 [Linepithema humile]|uniref:dynein regulatory complex subunit 2 isoform X2 n=1 Tax=Linepithema humile TaxID=83485 RepID=UPI0006236DB4|nr:PREDICTED: coiled-coil domain-containing protein 65 [Linepithema humile]